MPRPRQTDLELNFDGLTDAITNLAGSLVMLVVLVVALTRPKELGLDSPLHAPNQAGAEVSVKPLLSEIGVAEQGLQQMEQEIMQIEARLPELAVEVDTLTQDLQKRRSDSR